MKQGAAFFALGAAFFAIGASQIALKSGGSGGSSRIKVMVTRRLGAIDGLSGNNGSVSAFPATI